MKKAMFVTVGVLGGRAETACVEEGSTLQDVLKAVELSETGIAKIRVNKRQAELTDEVYDGDIVVLVPKIKGG